MMSAKNFMLTGAASADLGLGDGIKAQLESEEEERKKKLLKQAQNLQAYGPATQTLFGGTY